MNIANFTRELKNFNVFNLKDIEKLSSKVYYHRLIDWQKKGYIKRIANGMFAFADVEINDLMLFYFANRIYEPSYVSLESALSYYGMIPEAVYTITSVSSKKTSAFVSEQTTFTYRKIAPRLLFGYILVKLNNTFVKIAEPEKALLDFFYLNSKLNSMAHIEELRFNQESLNEKIDLEKLDNYLTIYNNKSLSMRLALLKEWMQNA